MQNAKCIDRNLGCYPLNRLCPTLLQLSRNYIVPSASQWTVIIHVMQYSHVPQILNADWLGHKPITTCHDAAHVIQ
jgi:hypothetical protein